jgi:4-amino-4-deoxy-L-arabinose transferase-like glycosyltransferase
MTSVSRDLARTSTSRAGLLLALAASALLRFWALPQGVPFSVQVDEPEVMLRAVRMMRTGDLNPHFFDYPTLYMYVQALVAVVRFLIGAMRGQWASLAQAPPEAFYVWGRAVTAAAGTATVWVVYRAGMRWGSRTALLAAAMFAVMPLHVRESHFVLTDAPATFFVMLTLLLSFRAHERATIGAFAVAGMAAGLAAATKYNAALAGALPLVAWAATPGLRGSRIATPFAIVGGMIAAFLVAAPYSFLDLPTFLNQFARLSSEYRGAIPPEPPAQTYLKHLRIAYGSAGGVIVVAGMALGVFRVIAGPGRLKWALATLFPLLYFRFIANQNIVYARYLLPMLPFLSLLGAAAVVAAVDFAQHARLPRTARTAIIVGLTLAAIVPPAYTAISFDAAAAKVWTTEQAYAWILREIPAGSRVTLESRQILLPASYKATYVPQLRLHTFESYVDGGVEYLIASSQCYGPYMDPQSGGPQKYPAEYGDYMRIFRQAQELARFIPSKDHPGPELRVLRIVRSAP